MPFISHTSNEIKSMLEKLKISSIDELFDEIPPELRTNELKLPEGKNEMEMLKLAEKLAQSNQNLLCFLGAGSYEHHIPAAVWDLTSRGEFMTAYTPYQAEASQGTLQLLYEYQTMMAELTGMEVSNASLYDGATALAEAILMGARIQKKHQHHRILVPQNLHPYYQSCLKTLIQHDHIELVPVEFSDKYGTIDVNNLASNIKYQGSSILIISQPNFFGNLENVHALTDWAHQHQILVIAHVNPTSLALLNPPGAWGKDGADIVCGEGQPLGIPMASGGPYFGFLTTKMNYVRQMPGRIVGRTVDKTGRTGFTLTLQAREQHIRRDKATSNICTNQGLLVTAATIYMSLVGYPGLHAVANKCHEQTIKLINNLCQIPGVKPRFNSHCFHEQVLELPCPPSEILSALKDLGILGGLDLSTWYPELGHCILICATEMRSDEDIETYSRAMRQILSKESRLCILSN